MNDLGNDGSPKKLTPSAAWPERWGEGAVGNAAELEAFPLPHAGC